MLKQKRRKSQLSEWQHSLTVLMLVWSLIGGFVFGGLFFLIYGLAEGFSWFGAAVCLSGGLFWGISFFLILFFIQITERFRKKNARPIRPGKGLQKKLSAHEAELAEPYDTRIIGFASHRTAKRAVTCETVLYFMRDRMHFVCVRGGKLYRWDVPYEEVLCSHLITSQGQISCFIFLQRARKTKFQFLLRSQADGETVWRMREVKRLYRGHAREENGALFVTYAERRSVGYVEFRYCDGDSLSLEQRCSRFCREDSLYVHLDDFGVFFESYGGVLSPYGDSFRCFSKQETEEALTAIRETRPCGSEVLIPWLKKAVNEYEGFFFGEILTADL